MENQSQNKGPNQKNIRLEDIFSEAEDRFRSGLSTLNDWSEQVRDVVQDRPGVLVGSLAVAGFLTGLVFRRSNMEEEEQPGLPRDFLADPVVVFITGAIAGFTVGPRIVKAALQTPRQPGREGKVTGISRH